MQQNDFFAQEMKKVEGASKRQHCIVVAAKKIEEDFWAVESLLLYGTVLVLL